MSCVLGDDASISVVQHPRRGRGIVTERALEVGSTISVGGPPYAAVLLPSLVEHRCSMCLKSLSQQRRRHHETTRRCNGCGFVCYCSAECEAEDARQHSRQCAALSQTSSFRRMDDSRSEHSALGRMGAALLAGRCLWRRHDEAEAQRDSAVAHAQSADAICFDMMAPGPTSEADEDVGALVEQLDGFLPPGASSADVVAMLGSFRINEFSILDAHGTAAIGVGCYPRAALLNHS